ncbi:MAG: DUF1697 domain-containing protein [Thermoplasmata archaeon]|nr:DUF1697 domain-containing protein [Thermoplasmata archaeon]
MSRYVALLRAVNLVKHQRIEMAAVRTMVTELGFSNAQTLLASGNIVFEGARESTDRVEKKLEEALDRRFAIATEVFVRTSIEWAEIVTRNPFGREARNDPGHLLMLALKGEPDDSAWARLSDAISGPELARGWGRHGYIVYPRGVGTSRLTSSIIETRLGTRATARNWNTVLKLATLSSS